MADYGLAGQVAFVTGAGGGIGAAVVDALLAEGVRVGAVDRDAAALDALTHRVASDALRTWVLDVRDTSAVDTTVSDVEVTLGPIPLLVNVAGVLTTTRLVDTSDEAWAEVFAVNVHGVFAVSRAVARRMIPRRRGAIVTVSSNAAGIPRYGMGPYAASKAASTMLTRCLGLELAEHGIRCNVVAPGSTRTPMQQALLDAGATREGILGGSLETFRPGIPLKKIAEPSEVADAVLYLLSARASQVTMAEIYVDGGASL
ncbi:MAG: 2,3-dihydro-2,3-dihydroxybenzoate dehydrogenase [Vicinamibacterales bacterium]